MKAPLQIQAMLIGTTLVFCGWGESLELNPQNVSTMIPSPGVDLFTAGSTFTLHSRYVSTSVFTWYSSSGGQVSGPWRPQEGRPEWTGESAWWETQVKQMMAANIDVLQVETFGSNLGWSTERINLFQALHDLRSQGYNVPKVAPFLDTSINGALGWTPGQPGVAVDLGASAGKDTFVNKYVEFYNQYYSVNSDAHADSYIAQIDGRVVLDSYVLHSGIATNLHSLTREDVQSRLENALGGQHALFANLPSNGIFMINIVAGDHYSFEDERLIQFENASSWYKQAILNGRLTAQVMPGYWDANVRNPENAFLPRDGGIHYKDAWTSVQANRNSLKHVYVESWNEYDEGTGIYAANPGEPYIAAGNTHTDTWSATNDPYEYIKTTAKGARLFNDTPDLDASIISNSIPTVMQAGEKRTVHVVLRNDGDISWTGETEFKFGQNGAKSEAIFMDSPLTEIDDAGNEIPIYGGIFRGRPITFTIDITAPITVGTFDTYWQMKQGDAWFGDELALPISVVPEPSPADPPTYTPNGGTFTNRVNVTWSSLPTNATIYYTTDGSLPTTNSASVTGGQSIILTALYSNNIKAFAKATDYSDSAISTSQLFTLTLADPPVISGVSVSGSNLTLMVSGWSLFSTNWIYWTTNLVTGNWIKLMPFSSNDVSIPMTNDIGFFRTQSAP